MIGVQGGAPSARHRARSLARRSLLLARSRFWVALHDPRRRNPVIVFTMGKVGSTSVAEQVDALLPRRGTRHVHTLTTGGLQAADSLYRTRRAQYRRQPQVTRFFPWHVWEAQHVRRLMARHPTRRWDVVSLVRDPVRRDISTFFQTLEIVHDYWPAQELERCSTTEVSRHLVELFLDTYVFGRPPPGLGEGPMRWFQCEMQPVFGVDVYSTEFPTDRGFNVYTSANARVLVLRLESLGHAAPVALRQFFGVDVHSLPRSNKAADKAYSDVYRDFTQRLVLPDDYLERVYSSQFATHFYSDAELLAFRQAFSRSPATG